MTMVDDVLAEGETLLFEPCAGEPLRKRAFASWAMQHGAGLIRIARAAQRWNRGEDGGAELRAALDALGGIGANTSA